MKVEFLNAECTLAQVTRGALWWKRRATLRRKSVDEYSKGASNRRWIFASGNEPNSDLDDLLDAKRRVAIARGVDNIDWQRVDPLPQLPHARLLKERTE